MHEVGVERYTASLFPPLISSYHPFAITHHSVMPSSMHCIGITPIILVSPSQHAFSFICLQLIDFNQFRLLSKIIQGSDILRWIEMPHHKTADDITELYWGLHLTPILLFSKHCGGSSRWNRPFFHGQNLSLNDVELFPLKMFWWYLRVTRNPTQPSGVGFYEVFQPSYFLCSTIRYGDSRHPINFLFIRNIEQSKTLSKMNILKVFTEVGRKGNRGQSIKIIMWGHKNSVNMWIFEKKHSHRGQMILTLLKSMFSGFCLL